MTRTITEKKDRVFTVELKSKSALKSASLDNGAQYGVQVEGTLGTLVGASFQDGLVLEVIGTQGVLRVDLMIEEIIGNPSKKEVDAGEAGSVKGGWRG